MTLPSDDVLEIWNRIMKYQVDFSFPLELPVFLNNKSWCTARRILDLGSGDGYYATRLANYFPDKAYTCVDIDERAIKIGKNQANEYGNHKIKFSVADILRYNGDFPVAIARLLVQHLSTPEELFSAASNFLNADGTLIVIDSSDEARLFWPTKLCRHLELFFQTFTNFQPGRKNCINMPNIAADYGFNVESTQTIIIPSSIPTYKKTLYESYRLVFEVVRKHYNMPFDYKSLLIELERWAQSPRGYAQIGVNASIYRRREAN